MTNVPIQMHVLLGLFHLGCVRLQEMFIERCADQNIEWSANGVLQDFNDHLNNQEIEIINIRDINMMDISLLSKLLLRSRGGLSLENGNLQASVNSLRELRNLSFHTPPVLIQYPQMIQDLCRTLRILGVAEEPIIQILGVVVTIVISNQTIQIFRNVLIDWINVLGRNIETRVNGEIVNFSPDFYFGNSPIYISIRDQNGNYIDIAKELSVWVSGSLLLTYSSLFGLGFTSTGIASGSIASGIMSSAAIANGGGIAAGSVVSVCQSAMAGTFIASPIGVGVIGLAATGMIVRRYIWN